MSIEERGAPTEATPTQASELEVQSGQLTPVEPGYRHVLRIRSLIFWVPLSIAAIIVDRLLLAYTPVGGVLGALVPVLGLLAVVVIPSRRYQRLAYALHPAMLQVVRGWLFHTDTVVPLVRVQHIDVTRGPLDKSFGTATLVVHTAGTHNSIVILPGLSPEKAAAIRDEIRQHIRSDFE